MLPVRFFVSNEDEQEQQDEHGHISCYSEIILFRNVTVEPRTN